jgi:phosphatidylinositol glycan class O
VQASKGCRLPDGDDKNGLLEMQRKSELVNAIFGAIHQIDLVPTITKLLGLPIPFANLGGLDPTLLPGSTPKHTATALALNAAQVWRYFTIYSETANRLPGLPPLQEELDVAVSVFVKALLDPENPDVDQFVQASTLFKSFLQNALTLGQHVWKRFYSLGMVCGVSVLVVAILLYAWPLWRDLMVTTRRFPISQTTEVALT